MKYDEKKLEKWASNIPECEDFLFGFFINSKDYAACTLENYVIDVELYSLSNKNIRDNSERLFDAFYDISGRRVYYE